MPSPLYVTVAEMKEGTRPSRFLQKMAQVQTHVDTVTDVFTRMHTCTTVRAALSYICIYRHRHT